MEYRKIKDVEGSSGEEYAINNLRPVTAAQRAERDRLVENYEERRRQKEAEDSIALKVKEDILRDAKNFLDGYNHGNGRWDDLHIRFAEIHCNLLYLLMIGYHFYYHRVRMVYSDYRRILLDHGVSTQHPP